MDRMQHHQDNNLSLKNQETTCSEKSYPQGIKWTRQRKDVYQVLLDATEPLSAVQIYDRILKMESSERYAISTIYRILTAFEENDIVIKSNWMGGNIIVYELNRGEHTHYAMCLNCHKRIPLHECPFEHHHVESMHDEKELADAGFQVTGHKLELYGYCKQCQGK